MNVDITVFQSELTGKFIFNCAVDGSEKLEITNISFTGGILEIGQIMSSEYRINILAHEINLHYFPSK